MSLLKNNTSVCIPAAKTPDYPSNLGRTVSACKNPTALNEDQFVVSHISPTDQMYVGPAMMLVGDSSRVYPISSDILKVMAM